MKACPKCQFESENEIECDRCGIVFRKVANLRVNEFAPLPLIPSQMLSVPEGDLDGRMISYTDARINLLALPSAILFGVLAEFSDGFEMLVHYFFSIPLHEAGHALTAWFCGRAAFPVGMFIPMAAHTYWLNERNLAFVFAMMGGLAWIILKSLTPSRRFRGYVSFTFLIFICILSFFVPKKEQDVLIVFGGKAGEIVLSTLFMVSFYHRISDRLRWDFFRFLFLVGAACSFCSTLNDWYKVSHFQSGLYMGSFLEGREDLHGDMNVLMREGWTIPDIINRYYGLGKICILILIGQYVWVIYRWKKSLQASLPFKISGPKDRGLK